MRRRPQPDRTLDRVRAQKVVSGGFVVVVAVGLAAASSGLTAWVLRAPAPAPLADEVPVTDVAVVPSTFLDARTVQITAVEAEQVVLTGQASGTVTASGCTVGGVVESGAPVVVVDATPVVAFATARPLWRDLAVGDRGEDVRDVQGELARLGYSPGDSGRVDRATAAAVRAFAGDRGVRTETGGPVLARSSVVWLPQEQVQVTSCPAAPGREVQPGDELATVGSPLLRAVAVVPAGLVPGDRMLRVDDVSIPVGADGVIHDVGALTALAVTPSYRETQDFGDDSFSGVLQLQEPLDVISVPSAAVYGEDSSGAGCVVGDDAPRAVQVVASELGTTLVTVTGPVPGRVSLVPDRGASCASS